MYRCKCDCGNEKDILAVHLRSGHTQSCGCFRAETAAKTRFIHGDTNERIYIIWKNMKARCLNKNHDDYPLYGGRGISICDEWKDNYINFKTWAINNHYSDNLSLDRIDVNGNYCPENCRWITQKGQCNNTRQNVILEYQGELHTMKEWSEILGINYGTLYSRIRRGWNTERALTV